MTSGGFVRERGTEHRKQWFPGRVVLPEPQEIETQSFAEGPPTAVADDCRDRGRVERYVHRVAEERLLGTEVMEDEGWVDACPLRNPPQRGDGISALSEH